MPTSTGTVIEASALVAVCDGVLVIEGSFCCEPTGAGARRSCDGGDCRDLVYADSITAVSAPGFRYSDDPDRVAEFRATIDRIAALDCDLAVSAHPGFTELFEKAAARDAGKPGPAFFDGKPYGYVSPGGTGFGVRTLVAVARSLVEAS